MFIWIVSKWKWWKMVRHSNGMPKDISIWFFGTHTNTQSPYRRKCNSISMFSSVEQICNFNYRNWLGKLCWLKSKVRNRQIQHAMPSLTVDNLFEMLERCNWIIYICYHKWAVHKIQSGQSLYGSELALRMAKEFACLLTCSLAHFACPFVWNLPIRNSSAMGINRVEYFAIKVN